MRRRNWLGAVLAGLAGTFGACCSLFGLSRTSAHRAVGAGLPGFGTVMVYGRITVVWSQQIRKYESGSQYVGGSSTLLVSCNGISRQDGTHKLWDTLACWSNDRAACLRVASMLSEWLGYYVIDMDEYYTIVKALDIVNALLGEIAVA